MCSVLLTVTRLCEYLTAISRNTNQNKLDFNSEILNNSEKGVRFIAFELKFNEKKIAF